jgi:hypothetical protein
MRYDLTTGSNKAYRILRVKQPYEAYVGTAQHILARNAGENGAKKHENSVFGTDCRDMLHNTESLPTYASERYVVWLLSIGL